jgi:alpha-amylase
LANLPDLDQSNSFVKSTILSWIINLVKTYNLDGIRIDTIPEVPKAFWAEFSQAAGVFQIGEIFDGRIDYVSDYQNYIDATLNYPLYFKLKDIFIYGHGMNELENFYGNDIKKWKDPTVLGVFVDNHDNARFLSLKNDYVSFKAYIMMTLGSSIHHYFLKANSL